jgi:hypothetical protein
MQEYVERGVVRTGSVRTGSVRTHQEVTDVTDKVYAGKLCKSR